MKRESRLHDPSYFNKWLWLKSSISIFALVFAVVGCNNIKTAKRALASLVPANDGYVDTTSAGSFVLSTVLPSQNAPGSTYDMIGEGNQFDSFCPSAASCKCKYSFTQTNVGAQVVLADVSYAESNLLRCVNSVPSGVAAFDVSLMTVDGVYVSNTITVNLNNGAFSGSTFFLDLTAEASFVPVKRFQCRQLETVVNFMDNNMIDPIQSEDPRIIYPFNYYTTNVGQSMLKFQQNGNQKWECTLTPTKDHSLHWWSNPNIFSLSTCTDSYCVGDGEVMAPQTELTSGLVPVNGPTNGRTRASFSLAKQAYGVFQIPVMAATAPTGTSYTSATYAGIGYAAKPIPSGTSSSCPNITLPPNSRWVKLWNYRATDITAPRYVSGASALANGSTGIACYPGSNAGLNACDFDMTRAPASTASNCDTTNNRYACNPSVFKDDNQKDNITNTYFSANQGTFATPLTRVFLINGQSPQSAACYKVQSASWIAGGERWEGSPYAYQDLQGAPSLSVIQSFLLGIYATITAILPGSPVIPHNQNVSAVPEATPMDASVQTANFTNDNYTDNLFVVTSTSVDDNAMKVQSSSVAHFRPITYRSKGDCNASTRSGCPVSQEIHWDINTSEIGAPNNQGVYPLCVLQFYE